jgi:putative ABC transport system permease protein
MSSIIGDVRYAARSIVRQPGYALLVVLMMTLGVAGNAAVFRIFNGLFLRPLPFDHPEQLVDLDETAPQWDLEFVGIAYPDFVAWRRDTHSFAGMAAFTTGGRNLAGDGEAERVDVVAATHDLASVLGFQPLLGRFFTEEEDRADGALVTLLSYGFWQRYFGGAADVLGRTLSLSAQTYEVIGVLPPSADFVSDAGLWIPLQEDPQEWHGWYLTGVGRLRPGATIEQARTDLLSIHRGMAEERSANAITSPVINPIRERYLGQYRLGSSVLLGAVGIILLIACANIAGLLLARSLAREREIGIRVAMGASRGRIVRQLLAESLLLASVGAALGAAGGYWGSSALVAKMSEQLPQWVTFQLDGRFVLFTLAVTLGAALVFGLVPAWQASGADLRGALHGATNRMSASLSKRRGMSALVAGEVGLALVLLIVAGLSARDLLQLEDLDPGYKAENVLTYSLVLPSTTYTDGEQRLAFVESHLAAVRALPGVVDAAVASSLPLSGHWGWFFSVEGAPERGPDEPNPVVLNRIVTPSYFATLGVTLKAGRGFDDFDGRQDSTRAVIVNESFVRAFFAEGEDPIGRRIRGGGESPWMQVVGIARDVKHYGVDRDMRPGVYQPIAQFPLSSFQVAIRTSRDPGQIAAAARNAVGNADPELAVFDVRTMQQRADESLWTRRASAWMIAAFSTVALTLAVAGLYGVISYGVGQRTHEIGIRMALGARRGQVLGRVMGQGLALVGVGIVAGIVTAVALAHVVAGLLVGVSATDPIIYAGVSAILVVVAAVANYLPARRAAALHPMGALRSE